MKSSHSVFRIGIVQVDPSLDVIYKDGTQIKLEPRTMRLLVCLAQHAGEVVSVDELLLHVWKDVVVSPYSVYQAVAALRRVLGDNPKAPKYIANVVRRGYRLVAPVSCAQEARSLTLPTTIIAATRTVGGPARRWWATVALIMVALATSYAAVLGSLTHSPLGSSIRPLPPTANPAAYTLYLKSRAAENGSSSEDYQLAISYVQQALSLDPDFQQGWAQLADLMIADLDWHDSRRSEPNCAAARNAAGRAVQLDPDRAGGRAALGRVLAYCDWNWSAAELQFRHALAIDPTDPDVLKGFANFDWAISRAAEQLELAKRLVQQDPLNSASYNQLAVAQGFSGQYEASIVSWKRAIELNPTQSGLHALLSNAYLAAGKPLLASDELEREPDTQFRAMNWPFVYDALGRIPEADAAIESYERGYADKDPETLAVFYACRRRIELSIQWLERTVAQHGLLLDVPNKQACFKVLDQDPRYQAVVKRVNSAKWPNIT